MKAIEITQFGAPEVLQMANVSKPSLKAGEALIKVSASGINRLDIFQRKGAYPPPAGVTDIPGLEVAGEIVEFSEEAVEENPFQLKKGDKVCALVAGGGYAEYVAAPLLQCLPIPSGLSELEAASLPETYFTVWSNVFGIGRLGVLSSDETLLVQGGSSGIGVAAIQIAHALGFRVFTTAGTDEKCAFCKSLGADRAINYKKEDFVEVIQFVTEQKGVDVILDMVAGDYVSRELEALARHGRLVLIAMLGGATSEIDCKKILFKQLCITGSTLRSRSIAEKAKIVQQLYQNVWPLLSSKKVKPIIDKVFPAEEVVNAHRLMESGQHIGKIMLSW